MSGVRSGELCEGRMPSEYVSGIDWFCTGSASRQGRRHDRVYVLRVRWWTCELAEQNYPPRWWLKGQTFEEQDPTGAPLGRAIAECPYCTFAQSVGVARIQAEIEALTERHARRVHRRNASTLLDL